MRQLSHRRAGLNLPYGFIENYAPFSTFERISKSSVITSAVTKNIKKYIIPNRRPIKPVDLGASGVPPPTNITIAATIPTIRETQDNTLNTNELISRSLYFLPITPPFLN